MMHVESIILSGYSNLKLVNFHLKHWFLLLQSSHAFRWFHFAGFAFRLADKECGGQHVQCTVLL